jgi:hypothetical protein
MILDDLAAWADWAMSSRLPDVYIGGEKDTYLRRWFVIPRNPIFNIFLHEFMRSDDDRALHDHPWISLSIILSGEYTEQTIAAGGVVYNKIYRAGDMKFRFATHTHRIVLHNGPCRTLFITGPKIREWGFHCPNGWRHWKDFTKPGNSSEIGKGCD